MKIRIPRPDDPELAALWDEAKRNVLRRSSLDCEHANEVPHRCKCSAGCPCRSEMCPIGLTLDDETRPIWEAAQRAAAEVAAWPAWKHNELPRNEDCCVRDVSRCRCAVGQPVTKPDEEEQQWHETWEDA